MARRLAATLLLLLSQTGDARVKKGSGVVRQPAAGDGELPRGYTGPQSTQSSRSSGVDVTAAPRSSGIPLANTQGQNPDDPVVMWERAKALLESCPVSRAIGEPCDTAEDSAGVWLVLTELLEPSHFDVGFNYALALERFDQYYDAVLVWESVIRANPSVRERAVSECSKVISLIAREMGVPGAGSEHPDPEIEKRRRRERAQQGVTPDLKPVGGALGEEQSEMRHMQDDAMSLLTEARRLMLSKDCTATGRRGVKESFHRVRACHERAVALLGLLAFVVPADVALVGQLLEALVGAGRYKQAEQLANRIIACAPLGQLSAEELTAEGRELQTTCNGMFLGDVAAEEAMRQRDEVWEAMALLCEEVRAGPRPPACAPGAHASPCLNQRCPQVDRPALVEAEAAVLEHGGGAGWDRPPEEIFVQSQFGRHWKTASYADDVAYWSRRVDQHCPPTTPSENWDAAPTEQGLHNPERLPQMLRARGVRPPAELSTASVVVMAVIGGGSVAVACLPGGKRKGRRNR